MRRIAGIFMIAVATMLLMQSCALAPLKSNLNAIYKAKISGIVKVHIGCIDHCGSGTGTLFYSPKADRLFVLSNSHVLDDPEYPYWIEFADHKIFPIYIMKSTNKPGTAEDFAIGGTAKNDRPQLMKRALRLTKYDMRLVNPRMGTKVYTIGAPWGFVFRTAEGWVNTGEGLIEYNEERDRFRLRDLGFSTTAYSAPGSSGSAIWDDFGNLTGLVWGSYMYNDGWSKDAKDDWRQSLSVSMAQLRLFLAQQDLI